VPTKQKSRQAYYNLGLLPFQVWIPTQVKRRLQLTAIEEGLTMNEVVSRYLDRHLPNITTNGHQGDAHQARKKVRS